MSFYKQMIIEDTKVDEKTAHAVEAIMRHVVFGSTLDSKTRGQFEDGAKKALTVFKNCDRETQEWYLNY